MRIFARRERPHPGAQLSLFEAADGWRYSLWVTNLPAATKGWRGQCAYIRPASVSAGGSPRAASRTRRARYRAPGSPQVPSGAVCVHHPVACQGVGIAAPRYRYRVVLIVPVWSSRVFPSAGCHPPPQ